MRAQYVGCSRNVFRGDSIDTAALACGIAVFGRANEATLASGSCEISRGAKA